MAPPRALLPLLACNLSGTFTYLPEPGSRYAWLAPSPSALLVTKTGGNGGDPWSNASGVVALPALTLSFHYPSSLGGQIITKNGTILMNMLERLLESTSINARDVETGQTL